VGKRRAAIGLAVSLLFVALLLWRVDFVELGDAFTDAQPAWLAVAFGVYLVALWVRGARWRLALRGTTRISTNDATALVVIGYAANNVLPMRIGELVRVQLLHERHGADRARTLGTIGLERILDGLVLALFLAATIALAGGNATLQVLAAVMGAGFVALTLGLMLLGPRLARDPELATRLLAFAPGRLRGLIAPQLARLLEGLTAVRGAGAWTAIVVVSATSWALEAAMYLLVGVGMGLDLDAPLYLAVCGAANLAIAVPWTSGGIGPFELLARETTVVFGTTIAVGTAYAIALHALLLIPVVLLGLLLLWRRHIAVGTILRAGDGAAEAPPAAREPLAAAEARKSGS
jgi:hypothetical protein